jgi:hypothetical protein
MMIGLRLLLLRCTRNETNRLLAKQAIAAHLGQLGGISMKIGQLVADVGNAAELRTLLDGKQARPLAEMLPALSEALGQPVDQVFSEIAESVRNQDEILVDMTMPAQAALELEDIMPDNIRHRLGSTIAFNFDQLQQELIESQFTPRDIVSIDNEGKALSHLARMNSFQSLPAARHFRFTLPYSGNLCVVEKLYIRC